MHGILPSEIARLVLDYLEASSCPEAARIFLETSPDLQECRRVAATGGRFITRVFGLTLVNILQTFCDIYGLVQEKLNKVDNDGQIRRSGDLCEQLRTLIDDCRGQRFFVNINVPVQSSNHATAGGSPIITSSTRRRRHSGLDTREKCSRSSKSQSLNDGEKSLQPTSALLSDNNVKATDQLSIEKATAEAKESHNTSDPPNEKISGHCIAKIGETSSNYDKSEKHPQLNKTDNSAQSNQILPKETNNSAPEKLSTGTDTQELMIYSTAEVQTTPYDVIESESETTNEPVENLSLLTKELLNRTELQERIAENINKAILPTDGLSLKDLSFSECVAANDCNTSIMTELNNAIKSIVTATEKDPVFEKFFDEIFQAEIEGEQSQDGDIRLNTCHSNESPSDASPASDESPKDSENEGQNIPATDVNNEDPKSAANSETDQVNAEFIKTNETTLTNVVNNQTLEDVNAAAVESIINANNKFTEVMEIESHNSSDKQLNCPQYNLPVTNPTITTTAIDHDRISPVNHEQNNRDSSNVQPQTVNNKKAPVVKKSTRKPKVTRQKAKPPVITARESLLPTETMISVPTLVVCNKNEIDMSDALPIRVFNNIAEVNTMCTAPKPHYIPIAPKDPSGAIPSSGTLYVRTVNVARKISTVDASCTQIAQKLNSKTFDDKQSSLEMITEKSNDVKIVTEAITLYSTNDNNSAEILEAASLPTISIDETTPFSGSGLSPFLKFNERRPECSEESKNITDESKIPNETKISHPSGCEIMKRTPKSLLKSRSTNQRLSLSTPRRKSGHIRALDFNTPAKEINSNRRLSETSACPYLPMVENSKSTCRTSLFKSPPFEGASLSQQSTWSSCPAKTPNADSSPVPKLYGGWDKVSGVATILEGTSPIVSSSQPPQPQPVIKKSWDADLRNCLDIQDEENVSQEKPRRRNSKINMREIKKTVLSAKKTVNIKQSEVELQDKIESTKLSPVTENNTSICDVKVLKTNLITETITVNKEGVTRKYAKLKTLATNIKRIDSNDQSNLLNINTNSEATEKSESIKTAPQILPSSMMDLETPRKNENSLTVPPTPRVLSPNNSISFVRVSEDSGKVRCFITTPEFPQTPCINLTPRQNSESHAAVTNGEYLASYYHPSSELKKAGISQLQNGPDQVTGSKPEIAQFEVIKDNLSKDEACKELNISINSKDKESTQQMKSSTLDEKPNANVKTNETNYIDSSDSDSETSSSSCSSSCSCNDDTTNNSSRMSTSRRSKDISRKNETQTSMNNSILKSVDTKAGEVELKDLGDRQVAQVPLLDSELSGQQEHNPSENMVWKKNEISPEKVFSIQKTQENLDEANMETPAKDENSLCEAEISETPIGSKSGIENTTNLSSKISAIIDAKESSSRKYQGIIRKVDSKLAIDNVKVNILASLTSPVNQDKNDKELSATMKETDGIPEVEGSLQVRIKQDSTKENVSKENMKNLPEAESKKDETVQSKSPKNLSVDKSNEVNKSGNTELLESLELVPASKVEAAENMEENTEQVSKHCHSEYSFVHDDNITTKKRNVKKFSPSDLEFTIQLMNNEHATMTATQFEILFTLPMKSVRARQVRKPKTETKPKSVVKSVKNVKSATSTKSKKLSPATALVSLPLATSSPVQEDKAPKVNEKIKPTDENTANPANNPTSKTKNSKTETKKQTMTTRKRKERSDTSESEPVEKKPAVTDPRSLLKRVNIDEFLTTVHGPITKN